MKKPPALGWTGELVDPVFSCSYDLRVGRRGTFRETEHTADLGIEVEADSLAALFETAGLGLFSLMVDPQGVEARVKMPVTAGGDGLGELMQAWLQELLIAFTLDGFVASAITVDSIGDRELEATLFGERYDEKRHVFKTEIKAATFHGLEVEQQGGCWVARIILDV